MPATASAALVENVRDLGVIQAPTSSRLWRDPQVLQGGWSSPVLVGRDELLERQELQVLASLTPGRQVAVSVIGPRGSGTTAVTGHLVATAAARLALQSRRGAPIVVMADASGCRTPGALLTALFRQVDPAFRAQGASTEFGCLLFVRRLRTIGKPVIVWVDQVRAPAELGRVVRAISSPGMLLPEGPAGLPTLLLVVSGEHDLVPEEVDVVRTQVLPLQGRELVKAIMTRANLAFQAPPSMQAVVAIADLVTARGWGLSMVGELLTIAGRNAEKRGGRWLIAEDVEVPSTLPRTRIHAAGFDAVVLEVLRGASGPLSVGSLKARVMARCRELGLRLPGAALMWRHLVGLEQRGLVSREVRLGGKGGSRTLVSLAAAR